MADEAATPATPEVPADLDALNDAELNGLNSELVAARAALLAERNEDGIGFARVREIRAAVREIETHRATVEDAIAERNEVTNDLTGLEQAAPAPADPTDPAAPAAEVDPEAAPADATPEPAVATAAVSVGDLVDNREPGTAPPADSVTRPRVASLTAPSDSRIFEPGRDMDFESIGSAVMDLARGSSYDGKTRVASLPAFEASSELRDMMLTTDSAMRNDALIREGVEAWRAQYDARRGQRDAVTAAICDPLDIIREIPDCVQSSEPFSDSLPSRPAGRLGFQYTPSMSLATMASGVDIWDEADQASVDPTNPSTWKPCVAVTCPTPSSVKAEAVTACFTFDNTTDMSNPERVRDAMSKINAQRARKKTARLLTIADTLSVHFEFAAPYGALAGLVQAVLTTLPQGKYPERLDSGTPYILFLNPGMLEALVIDTVNLAFPIDTNAVARYIEDECAAAGWNVSVVQLDDVDTAGQTPFAALPTVGVGNKASLPALGGTTRPFKARLIAPESALYFSTGSIEMGVERSPELNRQNRAQWFAEEYVGLAKHGCHPWYTLHVTLCPTGTRAALTSPFACPTSGS